jgi:hypothetical protein
VALLSAPGRDGLLGEVGKNTQRPRREPGLLLIMARRHWR